MKRRKIAGCLVLTYHSSSKQPTITVFALIIHVAEAAALLVTCLQTSTVLSPLCFLSHTDDTQSMAYCSNTVYIRMVPLSIWQTYVPQSTFGCP